MNPSQLTVIAFESHVEDERSRAAAARRASEARARRGLGRRAPADPAAYAEHVVIRSAAPWDQDALARLAALDSSRVPRGDALVAEVRGELIAAVGLADGHVVADPFRPTGDVVGLLRLRAGQLMRDHDGGAGGRLPALVRDRVRALAHLPRPHRDSALGAPGAGR